MVKNPFRWLANNYKKSVKKADKKGYAKDYKKCTELFFRGINVRDPGLHFSGIEYLDGYFIFGTGTNSVVHFHIDECPGWKFGIWWYPPKDNNVITGEFFTQFEETIDKFRPTRSEFHSDLKMPAANSENNNYSIHKVADIIEFIKCEPFLAFCRDYLCWDYNKEYHTREEAEIEYKKYKEYKQKKEFYSSMMDKKYLDCVEKEILPLFNNAKIKDQGENWFPRYTVIAPYHDNEDIVDEPGCYGWFPDDPDDDDKEIIKKLEEIMKEANEYADEYGFCYFEPFNRCVEFYEK